MKTTIKKIVLLLAIIFATQPIKAYDFSIDGIFYTILSKEDKTCEVSNGSNEYSGEIIIPATVEYEGETMTVSSIGNNAFYDCMYMTKVTLPNTITSIGEYSFAGCNNIVSVTIPTSVKTIRNCAFLGSDKLSKAEFSSLDSYFNIDFIDHDSNPLNVAHHLYIEGVEITDLKIPDSVTHITNGLFSGCESIKTIEFGSSVKAIGSNVFTGCNGLTSIFIGDSIETIGEDAFTYCENLESVIIGNSVTTIENSAFYGCYALKSIEIGEAVNYIGSHAFYSCYNLVSINLPEKITSIKKYTFRHCNSLTSITIPEAVTSIEKYAFEDCSKLRIINIPEAVIEMGEGVFNKCDALGEIFYLAEEPSFFSSSIFTQDTYEYAILYVKPSALRKCKAGDPWRRFKTIETYEQSGVDKIYTEMHNCQNIYKLDGELINASICNLPTGVYIIHENNQSKKIYIK